MSAQLSSAEIDAVVQRLAMVARPERIIIFGSYAKGRATDRSDLDVLVVVPTGAEIHVRPADLEPFINGSVIPVDVHIVTAEELAEFGRIEHHFLHSVLRSGRTVYQR